MPRHKHADVIHAWAEGEEIEVKTQDGRWLILTKTNPDWEATDYRIKPKLVKREGWVNVYKSESIWAANTSQAHHTKEDADRLCYEDRVACIRIEWEEEV